MFSICKQSHPATSVEFSISCHFYNSIEENIITAGANILKVFRIVPDVDLKSSERYSDSRPPKMRLECTNTFVLYGNVMSLQSVSLAGSQQDALLISFRDAKLSVVQFDADTHELKTLSLHYFEEEDLKGGWTGNFHIPTIRVDPDNRCAVMIVYGRKLVVLPFRCDNTLEEIEMQDVKPMKKTNVQYVAKTPILASYIIMLKNLDEKIDNIIDIQFLYGYYEPTLLIVYEPVRTFPGRIAVRSDTCTMVAISLNIQQRVHPIIWTVNSLPFDCIQALSVKKPLGGCLIVSINALIYLNQSVPPFGVSLNSISDHSTTFPLKPQDGINISLDAAQICFIDTDKLVLSLKGGELYVLTLFADSMRSMRNFHFNKAASSVLTSCMCVCCEEYLFLGSRLGNSLLLRFTEKDQNTVITIDDTDQKDREKDKGQPKKRLEEEELEVYGTGQKTSVQLTSFTFSVCDSILNVAPIGFMTLGERCNEDETETEHPENRSLKPDMEIVTSSGRGKNGALCVLQNSIKPHIITSFTLSGCTDVWTVFNETTRENNQHTFMILSQESTTMVLQTGDEINEIENTGFCNSQPTIHVGNLGNNRYIAQVLSKSIRLLQGTRLLQNIQIGSESPLTLVSICDPYVCVRTEAGQVITLALRETKGAPRLAVNKNTISSSPAVVGLSAYKDASGLFTYKTDDSGDKSNRYIDSKYGYLKPEKNMKIEDEEDLLYGESGNALKVTSIVDLAVPSKASDSEWWRRLIQPVKATYWLIVTRENGNMEIYFMPDMKLVYIVTNVGNGNKVLTDSMEFVPLSFGQQSKDFLNAENNNKLLKNITLPKEILLVGLGNDGSRPILFIRNDNELLIYKVFKYSRGHLKIRFKKLNHGIILPPERIDSDMIEPEDDRKAIRKIRYFENVCGYNGVLICGEIPHLIILTSKGELRTHRFFSNIVMRSFASFNNMNCPNGLIYFDQLNELQIAVLPTYLTYDSYWPVRKVPMRCTPTFITYHRDCKVYCVVTDTEEISNKYYRFNGEDKELTEENKGDRFIYPSISKFEVVLVAPSYWEVVPKTSIQLEDWEHIISFKNVHLAYEGKRSGFKEYICVGTNFNYSEDITSRGRILLYDIIEVVPEPDQPLTKYKFKEVYIKEQKGPVSAITHVLGFLVTSVGQKIYLWQLKDNDLIGVAFIDTNIYVHQMVSIKSMILVADVYKSISLLRFQEEYRTLSLVSRDYNPLNVFNIEYMVDNNNLGFLASDSNENLLLYMYQPESRESHGGQKLIRKSDYHLGQKVNAMFRVQCNLTGNKWIPAYDNKHITFFATLDGGLGFTLPLPEKTYRRLYMLQNVILTHMEHLCGLNPKTFRTIKMQKKMHINPTRSILDGDLVWSFMQLPVSEKQEVVTKIGAKIEDILSDLMEIDNVTSIF